MKKKLFALLTALVLLIGILPNAAAMMDPSDYGKWIGGTDSSCKHPAKKQTVFGDMPGDPDTPDGMHLHVVNCECGAQRIDLKECYDKDNDGICDGCQAEMSTPATIIGDLSQATVNVSSMFPGNVWYYEGTAIEPSVSVWMGDEYLYEGSDYTVSYSNNVNEGTATIALDALAGGRVTGSTSADFTIKKLNGDLSNSSNAVLIMDESWTVTETFPWTGEQIRPNVMVELDGNVTLPDSMFSVSYGENKEGRGTVTVKGTGETMMGVPVTGQRTVSFKIKKEGQEECDHNYDKEYVMVADGKDGTHNVVCGNCKEVLEENVKHEWEGGTSDGHNVYYKCVCGAMYTEADPYDLSKSTIGKIPDQEYTGEPITPSVMVKLNGEKLTEGEDFTVDYSKNVDIGKGLVTIKPVEGVSKGKKTKEFNIVCTHEKHGILVAKGHDDGKDGTHFILCDNCGEFLREEKHTWELEGSDGHNVKYTCVCGAMYTEADPYDLSKSTIGKIPDQEYTGEPITPSVMVKLNGEKLTEGEDFTVDYSKNVDIGKGLVTIKPVEGVSKGKKTKEFNIVCTHEKHETELVMNEDGKDGTHNVVCGNCKKVLQENVKHTWGLGSTDGHNIKYTCACGAMYTVADPYDLSKSTIGKIPDQEYTGEPITPDVKVTLDGEKLTEGEQYTVEYTKNIDIGEALVSIKPVEGISTGKKTKNFNIVCTHSKYGTNIFRGHDDGKDGTHFVMCDNCGEYLREEKHAWDSGTSDGKNVTYKCLCGASYSVPVTEDLSKAKVLYPAGKRKNSVFTEEQAKKIELEGLVKGVDYTQTITKQTYKDGREWFIITDEAIGEGITGKKVITVSAGCQHKMGFDYISEGPVKHKTVCKVCKRQVGNPRHTFVAKEDDKATWEECEQCGEKRNVVQKGTEVVDDECKHEHRTWAKEGINHPQFHFEVCDDCGKLFEPLPHVYDQIRVLTAATCTTNAVLERKCVCGRVDPDNNGPVAGDPQEYFAHHTWGDTYSSDYISHWQNCVICGERSDFASHTISNLKVEKEPTCMKDGRVSFDCAVCKAHFDGVDCNGLMLEKYPELKQYSALGHDFSGPVKYTGGEKNCTKREEGTHAATCVRCGTTDTFNAVAHSWAEQTVSNGVCEDESNPVIIEGTCECGATLKLSYTRHHSYVSDKSRDVEPTCIEPGKKNGHRCRYCGEFGNYDFVEALGHDWYELEDDYIEPTCTELGWTHWFCARCESEQRRGVHFLSPYGHHEFVRDSEVESNDDRECLSKAAYYMKCKYCGTYDDEGLHVEGKLAHDTYSVTTNDGKEMHGHTADGIPTIGQSLKIETKCRRCNRTLGTDYRTVWKTAKGTRFQIVPGSRIVLDDVSRNTGATIVTGQLGRDKGSYYESVIQKALSKEIQEIVKKYDYAE